LKKILNIRIHYTWIFVFILITTIVTTQFSEEYKLFQRISLGIVVSVLFMFVAAVRAFIINIASHQDKLGGLTTLYAFGGVHQESKSDSLPSLQPLLYLAKYLSHLIIAVICYGLYATLVNYGDAMLAGLAQWLGYIFFLLFLLHVIPAFPLDGGEILRTLIWRSTRSYYKATYTASLTGMYTGIFLIFIGILVFITGRQWNISLVIVLVGWIIQIAAGNFLSRIKTLMSLSHIKSKDIMTGEFQVLSSGINVAQLVREYVLLKGCRFVVIAEEANFKGLVTLKRIRDLPVSRWNNTLTGNILMPPDQTGTSFPERSADDVFEEMSLRKIDFMPVLEDGNFKGIIVRDDLLKLVDTRAKFGL
jgi:CBS domain-containing protein